VKAMLLTGIRQMRMQDLPAPEITSDTDVLLRMAAVGVCGSDIHYYLSGRIGSQVVQYPYLVGHECAGTVEKIGDRVSRVKVGDRVAVDPAMPCWQCDQCKIGRHHTCRKLRFLGCPGQADGCLSEYLLMPETSCFPIRRKMSFEQAVLSEPLAIGVYAARRSVALPGTAVGVLGVGPIGMSALLAAKAQGPGRIYATDKIDQRLALARRAGADWTGNPAAQDVVAEISAAEPLLLDVVFECCGDQEALDQAVDLLKPGGKLVLVGIPTVDRVSFLMDPLRRKELCIQNIRRQVDCVQPTLDAINTGQIEVDFMVTHRFGFEQTQQAFELVAGYQDGVMKAVIGFDTH